MTLTVTLSVDEWMEICSVLALVDKTGDAVSPETADTIAALIELVDMLTD